MQLPPEFRKFLSSLNRHAVDYLIIGGYAVIFHGYVRTTADIDIWVAVNPDNASRVEAAIRDAGFNPPWLNAQLFLRRGGVFRIGVEPLRLEIVTQIDGVEFGQCQARRVEAELDGLKLPFLGLDDLKTNKAAAGRPKDLADLDYFSKQ
jgi:hypothetical protein